MPNDTQVVIIYKLTGTFSVINIKKQTVGQPIFRFLIEIIFNNLDTSPSWKCSKSGNHSIIIKQLNHQSYSLKLKVYGQSKINLP